MNDVTSTASDTIGLVPRMLGQGYAHEDVDRRRAWLEDKTGCALEHIPAYTIPSEEMRGNIENPIGTAQIPLGVAGPLRIDGQYAQGLFYVPLATTEGALVRSYERGMVALSRSGGVQTRIHVDENRISPIFCLPDVAAAYDFVQQLTKRLRSAAGCRVDNPTWAAAASRMPADWTRCDRNVLLPCRRRTRHEYDCSGNGRRLCLGDAPHAGAALSPLQWP